MTTSRKTPISSISTKASSGCFRRTANYKELL